MNLFNYLKIGQLVSIELIDEPGSDFRHPSRVENITQDEIILASPIRNRIPVFLPAGASVIVWFWDSISSYAFKSKVINSISAQVPLLVIRHPKSIERVQKREYFRIKYSLDVRLMWKDSKGESQETVCTTRDLSGGGMMLVLTKRVNLKKDDEVMLDFEIDNLRIRTVGVIVWHDWELDSDGLIRSTLGIKYATISERERKHLVKSVYNRQIELRRKGLL